MPFLEKLVLSMLGGSVFGILAAIGNFSDGKPFSDVVGGFFGGTLLGTLIVLWWTRDKEGSYQTSDNGVSDLHLQLQKAYDAMAMYERNGDHSRASQWRSQIAIIESQLRNRGA